MFKISITCILDSYLPVFQDEFSVSEKVALQLAGLQAQVVLGSYVEGKAQRYRETDQYLCHRILNAQGRDWSEQLAIAHKVNRTKQNLAVSMKLFIVC